MALVKGTLRCTRVALVVLALGLVCLTVASSAQEDPIAVFNQAQDLHEKGDLRGAVKLYSRAIELNPAFPEAEYQRGIAELALGNDAEAERAFRRAVAIRPDWTLPMSRLGQLLARRSIETNSKAPEAADLLDRVLKQEPTDSGALVAMIDLKVYSNVDNAELKSLLEKAVAATEGKVAAPASLWTSRAGLENRLGLKDASRKSLARALAADAKNKRALLQTALNAIADGDLINAERLVRRLTELLLEPDSLNYLQASLMAADGNLEGAVKALDQIKNATQASNELRKRIELAKSTDAAALEKQLSDNPRNGTVLGRLCSLYRRTDPVKAIDYCRRASEAEPNNFDHAIGFGAALVQAKQYDAAIGLFKKIIALMPNNATAHANLATALFQLKRYPEAKAEYKWLTEAQPESATVYYLLGIVHDQLGEYMDAAANYQLFLKLADPARSKDEIDKVNFRMPALQKLIKDGKK